MALVDVLVDVLDAANAKGGLYIDVAAKLEKEDWDIRDDPSVVQLHTSDLMLPAIIRATKGGISLIIDGGDLSEWLRITFGAFPLLHARGMWVVSTTRAMNHMLLDQLIEDRVSVWVREDS